MNKIDTKFSERRNPSNQLISNMLAERRQLLGLLLQVDELTQEELQNTSDELFEEFCQVLVDYIAAGHFGLYERIAEGKERRSKVAKLAQEVYQDIEKSTQIALAFNEKYDPQTVNSIDVDTLHADLSQLAESITNRIEHEDKIISQMLIR